MPLYRPNNGRITSPQPVTHKPYYLPASVGGINALSGYSEMEPQECIYCHNLMPSELGQTLRRGYSEWANGVTGDKEIRTLVPYEGQLSDSSADRLWAVTEDGIFDVTIQNQTSPPLVQSFTMQGADSGWGVWTEFTNDANERFLQYADEENGLFEYDEDSGTWLQITTEITGVDPAEVAFVTTWKNRLWYIEKNSGSAWYLPPDAKAGAATEFIFGSKFEHGGDLLGIYNWTIDGGDGIDDFMVVISRGGDVLIYKGVDPDLISTDPLAFTLVGSWFVGEFPESRRCGISYGGEFYLLSTYGLTSCRDLLQGVLPSEPGKSGAAKINRDLRAAVEDGKDDREWAMTIYPSDGFLQILQPYANNNVQNALQTNQNLLTLAWGRWKGVPANCSATWSGRYYFADKNGSVWQYAGTLDGITIDGSNTGQGIEYDGLTSFQWPGGNPVTQKRVGFIRPTLLEGSAESLNIEAVYDYNLNVMLSLPTGGAPVPESSWDSALWDIGVWDFTLESASLPTGALGIGRSVAVAFRGRATSRITIIGWDISYTEGERGFL